MQNSYAFWRSLSSEYEIAQIANLRCNNDGKPQKGNGIVFFDPALKNVEIMKISQIIPAVLMSVALFACQPENRDSAQGDADSVSEELPPEQESAKLIEYLVGEWELQDAGNERQANAPVRLTFSDEARYVTYSGDRRVVDSGAYRMNEQLHNLYLESEANKQPREFELDLKQDLMTLTPKEQDGKGGSLTYKRVGS